jgi:predicted ATP-binding protein involved in virulence
MQVKRLKISAFRGIEALDLEFHPGANVLIGVNGVGKSSILECLAKLVFLYTDLSIPKGVVQFAHGDSVKVGHKRSENSITLRTSKGEEGTWHFGVAHDAIPSVNNEFRTEELEELRSSSPRPSTTRLEGKLFLAGIQDDLMKQIKADRDATNLPLGIYYPTSRIIPRQPFEDTDNRNHPYWDRSNFLNIQALEGRLDFTEFFTWFKEREDLENETRLETNPDHRDRQLEAIRNAIPEFLPGFSHLRIKRSPLRMVVTKNGQELIISQLSDGEKSLLTIIGDIARRLAICNPALENPLEGEGIILIDEIDAHLHPKWQRGIVPKLERTFPNCQFFIATHSPQIISDVRSENIYLLQQDAEGEVIAVHPEGTYGRDTNQILEDVMGVPERPEWTKQELRQLFRLIDSGDLTAARDLKTQLEDRIGPDEPKFARADVLIRRKEILGR